MCMQINPIKRLTDASLKPPLAALVLPLGNNQSDEQYGGVV